MKFCGEQQPNRNTSTKHSLLTAEETSLEPGEGIIQSDGERNNTFSNIRLGSEHVSAEEATESARDLLLTSQKIHRRRNSIGEFNTGKVKFYGEKPPNRNSKLLACWEDISSTGGEPPLR